MQVERIDHVVLTVKNIAATIDFYTSVMGMVVEEFAGGRKALRFGKQKINLHQLGHEFEPKAHNVTPGSGDLCFIINTPVAEAIKELQSRGVAVIEGPVSRTGAMGTLVSAYFRDPDGNLIEVANYTG